VHDVIPTQERLQRIKLANTNLCTTCKRADTIIHRITTCGDAGKLWRWTKEKAALMMRIDPRHIPPTWTVFPNFRIWPQPKHNAVLWLIAHQVYYTVTNRKGISMHGYMDFMHRAKWKTYTWKKRMTMYGNYLGVFK
jgi:hypothetical protein